MPILEFRVLRFYSISYLYIPFEFKGCLKLLLPLMLFRENPDGISLMFSSFFIASLLQRTLLTLLYVKIIVIMGAVLLFRIGFLEALPYR